MNSFSALSNLISVLDSREIAHLRDRLMAAGPSKAKSANKTQTLFEALLSKPDATTKQLSPKIYPKEDDKALKHLRIRLFNKILDCLGNNWTCKGNNETNALSNGRISIEILWDRSAYQALDAALPTFYRLAEKQEAFDAQIFFLQMGIRLNNLRQKSSPRLQEQLENALQKQRDMARLCCLADPILPGGGTKLPAAVQAMVMPFQNSESKRLKFMGLLLEGLAHLEADDAEAVQGICPKLFHLSAQHSFLAGPQHTLLAKCLAAATAIQLGDPHQALAMLSEQAQIDCAPPVLRLQAQQLKAEALCLSGNEKLGYAIFRKLLETAEQEPALIRTEQRRFFAGKAALQAKMPRQCLQIIARISNQLLKKAAWNLAFRTLQIQAMITAQQFDIVDLRIEALRKYLQKLGKKSSLANWYRPILRVLIQLMRKNFVFFELPTTFVSHLQNEPRQDRQAFRGSFSFQAWWMAQVTRQTTSPQLLVD